MTTWATTAPPTALPAAARLAVVLARAELRHLLRSPFLGLGLVATAIATALNATGGPSAAYNGVTANNQIVLGVMIFLAVHRTTSRARRDDADELVDGLPAAPLARLVATQLAAVAVAGLSLVIVAATYTGYLLADVRLERTPSLAELACQPAVALGAGLLGVMVGRWLPRTAAALGVVFALVFWSVASGSGDYRLVSPYVEFARYSEDGSPMGFHPGDNTLHVGWLVLLALMAGVGGALHAVRRRGPLLAVGAVVTALAAVTGAAQLP